MKELKEMLQESMLNEATQKYEVMFLSADAGAWQGYEDEDLTLSDLEEQMYEAEDIKRAKFTASSDDQALKKAQKLLDKYDDVRDCIAASVYIDNADRGEIVETIFSKAWLDYVKKNS